MTDTTIRIHRKTDGLLLIAADGQARFLTLWERILLALGLTTPATLAKAKEQTDHPDDIAVDRFAAAMKEKLARKRNEGRGGWDDKAACTNGFLSLLLRGHVEKGDPVDVANFAMMIHQRGEKIGP